MSDIIIIGGGAAGLMAGIGAANKLVSKTGSARGKVTILEKMPRPGRKIMITGKGRCNFTNMKQWNEFSQHVHPKANFIKSAFYNLSPEKLLNLFEDYGLRTVVERGDRAFPESHIASDVVDTLVDINKDLGVKLVCDCEVVEVVKDGEEFVIYCSEGAPYRSKKLIIATGGLSYPRTGSTGDGFEWAKEFGHKLSTTFPSLTALVPKGYKDDPSGTDGKGHIDRSCQLSELGKMLKDVNLKNVGVSLIIDGNEADSEFGDLDFTDGGIEGPIGFKLSRKAVKALSNGSKAHIIIDLKSTVSHEDLDKRIVAAWKEISGDKRNTRLNDRVKFKILFGKVAPLSIYNAFMKMNPGVEYYSLAKALKTWNFELAGYVGYERCVITAGGVATNEMVSKTMESKLVPGLYFAGEIIDMDADTGGYNLQLAFSSGMMAGESASDLE